MGRFIDRLIRHNGPFIARALRELAHQIELAAPGPARASFLLFINKKEIKVAEITVSDEVGTLNASVAYTDAKGAAVNPDGVPVWSSSDDAIASVTASSDGLSAVVTIGTPGSAAITVVSQETDNETGDAYELSAAGLVNVTAGDAVVGSVEFSAA